MQMERETWIGLLGCADPAHHDQLMTTLMPRLEEKQRIKTKTLMKEAYDTKVEFFTLKRGE